MTIIESILSPSFLASNLSTISLIMGAAILVLFSDFVGRKLVFPLADLTRRKAHGGLSKGSYKGQDFISKYGSEALATLIFILYVYLGASVLAEYVFDPILRNLQHMITIVVIILFLILSWIINTPKLRTKLMKS